MKPKCCLNARYLKEASRTANLLKIIAEENRLKIICILQTGERCVCDIWRDLNIPQNLASHHLKILKNAGIIKSRKDGLKMLYWIDPKAMDNFNSQLNQFLHAYEK